MDRLIKQFNLACFFLSGIFSFISLFSIFLIYGFKFPYLPALLIFLALPIISKKGAIFIFTLLLPVFGNRPGSEQVFFLFLIVIAINCGITISLFPNIKKFYSSLSPRNPVILLSSLYLLVSLLSLSSLPLREFFNIFYSQVIGPKDFSAFSYVLLNIADSTEEKLSYSIFSLAWTFLSYNLMLFVYYLGKEKKENLDYIIPSILCGLILTLIAGLLDYYSYINLLGLRSLDPVVNPEGRQFRIQSFFGHSGWFAEYVTLSIPFAMILLRGSFKFPIRLFLIVLVLLLGEYSLILSFQRGGWVSYPLTLLVIWASIYTYHKLQTNKVSFISALKSSFLKIAISIPLTLLATVGLFYTAGKLGLINADQNAVISRYTGRFTDITRSSDRTDFMRAGFKLGTLYPALGAGSESFAYRFNQEFNKEGGAFYKEIDLPLYGSSHNVYMQTFAGKGAAGLIILLSLIGYIIFASLRAVLYDSKHNLDEKIYLLSISAFCCAFLIYGNVQELFYIQILQFLFFIILGLAAVLLEKSNWLGKKTSAALLSFTAVMILLHTYWLVFIRSGNEKNTEYGCYGSEEDSKGREYRWCSPRAKINITAEGGSISTKVSIPIAMGHFKNSADINTIDVYKDEELVFSKEVEPLKTYNLDFEVKTEGKSKIPLEINSSRYFIPIRDLKPSKDKRVLSYKLFMQ